MERLTIRNSEGNAVARRVGYYDILDKLALYEDLEELLEQTYGECSGLLERAVRHLIKHEGAEFEKPLKSRLLTDEDVDKWQEYKQLEEQGLLMKLPIPLGKPYFEITKDFGIQTFTLRPVVAGRIIQNNLFGKTVFATLAEAEKALAEMKGE